jgi:predicted dehydrogenase
MQDRLSRRRFLELSAASTGTLLAGCATTRLVPADRPLRHACIGVGGMGVADMDRLASHEAVEIVALCDVDSAFLEEAAKKAPAARLYRDWRELFEKEHDLIDSVNVTTPDHMHAAITLEALDRHKHVYCQKPLTRTVAESRALVRGARRAGVVTQMGIQNHSARPYAQALELFRAGHIGEVYEVHVWSDRPAGWWPQGVGRPEGADEIPETLDWDLWLGVAPERPYKAELYHPFAWRGWKDFGTGAQGDMGCHLMDPAVWFLELGHPTRIRSEGPTPNDETYPLWSRVDYEFEATPWTTRGPLQLTWHDGGKKAYREILDDIGAGEEVWANACLFLGTKGALLASPYESPRLLPEERFSGVEMPEPETEDHWHQYVDACRGASVASAPFVTSAHLTEVALLGNIALHFPYETLRWDGERMRFQGRPEATGLLAGEARRGWG